MSTIDTFFTKPAGGESKKRKADKEATVDDEPSLPLQAKRANTKDDTLSLTPLRSSVTTSDTPLSPSTEGLSDDAKRRMAASREIAKQKLAAKQAAAAAAIEAAASPAAAAAPTASSSSSSSSSAASSSSSREEKKAPAKAAAATGGARATLTTDIKSSTYYDDMDALIDDAWRAVIGAEFKKPYYTKLKKTLNALPQKNKVYPPKAEIFNALQACPFSKVRVVIVGQDPYHGAGQGHGLSFSVKKGVTVPPSLRNIYKELTDDVDFTPPKHGTLTEWAAQGVLLLNTTLTVNEASANSHSSFGWTTFTDAVIAAISKNKKGVVFMLWGAHAQKSAKLIGSSNHYVLKSAHPSPMAANKGGWFGSKHFSKANAYLESKGQEPIDWQLSA